MKNDCRNAKLHFQMTFSLPSTSCLLKLPNCFCITDHTCWNFLFLKSYIGKFKGEQLKSRGYFAYKMGILLRFFVVYLNGFCKWFL